MTQMNKFLELLGTFKVRATDPALYGRNTRADVIFELVAKELELAILESEPVNLASFIPQKCIHLVECALHFDDRSEASWNKLGRAARDIQSGPS